MKLVMGIDPGIQRVGYGVIGYNRNNSITVYEKGAICTDSSDSVSIRLNTIYTNIKSVIGKHSLESIAVEKIFFAHNHQSILKLAYARGIILLACSRQNIPVFEYSPQEIKKAVVGTGSASKKQVQYMVRLLLNLKSIPKPTDTADSLALAICHLHCSESAQKIDNAT